MFTPPFGAINQFKAQLTWSLGYTSTPMLNYMGRPPIRRYNLDDHSDEIPFSCTDCDFCSMSLKHRLTWLTPMLNYTRGYQLGNIQKYLLVSSSIGFRVPSLIQCPESIQRLFHLSYLHTHFSHLYQLVILLLPNRDKAV